MKRLLLGALVGCSAPAAPAHPISNTARVEDQWILSEGGLGPLTETTESTTEALQRALPSLRVEKVDRGQGTGVIYEVSDPKEKLFYVVPDDRDSDMGPGEDIPRQYALTMFAIFVTSPKVSVEGKRWRVGTAIDNASDILACECWGADEVTACWTPAAHILLIFDLACDSDKSADGAGQAMLGKRIDRIMWKREPTTPGSKD